MGSSGRVQCGVDMGAMPKDTCLETRAADRSVRSTRGIGYIQWLGLRLIAREDR